ncbi:MAG: hypothetical protein WBI17_03770 [Clostridiaceae bacterium]
MREQLKPIEQKTSWINHFFQNILPYIIVVELVLGGSGRTIMFGDFLTIRYVLFFMAMMYFVVVIARDIFITKLSFRELIKTRVSKTYINLIIFFVILMFSIFNGFRNGYSLQDIFIASKGFLFILIIFPFFIFVDSMEKAKKLFEAMIYASVILAVLTILIFIFYGLNPDSYIILRTTLDKLDYGYIAMRGGQPAVFMKASPFLAIALNYEINMYINDPKKNRYVNITSICLLLAAVICTMSMGLWIASIVGVGFVIIVSFFNRRNIKLPHYKGDLLKIALVFVLFNLFGKINSPEAVANTNYIQNSLNNRLSSDDTSFIVKKDQLFKLTTLWLENPIFGKGFGASIMFKVDKIRNDRMVLFELFWNQLLFNVGAVGFLAYLWLIFEPMLLFFKKAFKKSFAGKDMMHMISLNMGMIIICIISSVNPFMNNPIGIGYLVIFLSSVHIYLKPNIENKDEMLVQ